MNEVKATAAHGLLERAFHLRENGTTVRIEMEAGVTTFLTMAYILAVNPLILSEAGVPLTFSIANGLALGFISYLLIKVLAGRAREVSPLVYVLAALFVLRYAYLGAG